MLKEEAPGCAGGLLLLVDGFDDEHGLVDEDLVANPAGLAAECPLGEDRRAFLDRAEAEAHVLDLLGGGVDDNHAVLGRTPRVLGVASGTTTGTGLQQPGVVDALATAGTAVVLVLVRLLSHFTLLEDGWVVVEYGV